MNAINIVYHGRQTEKLEADLFVGHQFSGSREMTKRLSGEGLFDNIYGYLPKRKASGVLGKLERVLDIISPIRGLRGQLEDRVDFDNKQYDLILASMATHFSVSLIFAFPNAKVIYFDDGLGSYIHELSLSMLSTFNQKIYKLLGKELNRIIPEKIYLNNPGFADSSIQNKVCALPNLLNASSQLWDIFRRVWNYSGDGYYRDHKLICMTQPDMGGGDRDRVVHDGLVSVIRAVGGNWLIRPHPRAQNAEIVGFDMDDHKEMWELICAEQITDSHVLLSDFSTAQFIPKMLFDIEPYIIFGYMLASDYLTPEQMEEYHSLIRRTREKYHDPQKVLVVESEEQLRTYLAQICEPAK